MKLFFVDLNSVYVLKTIRILDLKNSWKPKNSICMYILPKDASIYKSVKTPKPNLAGNTFNILNNLDTFKPLCYDTLR